MANPVTISRIENRIGTQDEFNSMYPPGYNGTGGFGNPLYQLSASVIQVQPNTPSNGSATITFTSTPPFPAPLPINSQITIALATTTSYNGTYFVTGSSINTVIILSTDTDTYVYNPLDKIEFTYNQTNYPDVLQPGELALCTDSRNIFIGNLNGEYVQLSAEAGETLTLTPIVISLVPAATFTTIPILTLSSTPFYSILYDLTDSISPNWNTPGTNFSRNGELQITSTSSTASLVDICTEINSTVYEVYFQAVLSGSNILIQYTSNFPGNLTFSTNTINWIPF